MPALPGIADVVDDPAGTARAADNRAPCGRRRGSSPSCPRTSSRRARLRVARPTWELNAPARPRSAVTAISRCALSCPVPTSNGGAVGESGHRRRQRPQHPLHPFGVGTGGLGLLLRATQLGCRHHLHGGGDLLRRLHAVDAGSERLQAGHAALLLAEGFREVVEEGDQFLLGLRLDLQISPDRSPGSPAPSPSARR